MRTGIPLTSASANLNPGVFSVLSILILILALFNLEYISFVTSFTLSSLPIGIITTWVGAILGGLGIYKYLIDFAGAGATVPLTGFGANLAKGAIQEVKSSGLLGAFVGGVKASAGGIAAAVFFGYLASLIAKPKIKKQ